MKKFLITTLFLFATLVTAGWMFVPGSSAAWTPSSSSSLKFWLDMNKTSAMTFSTSNNIATITDQSTQAIVATFSALAGTNAQQVASQINGNAVFHSNTKSGYSFSAAPYDQATTNGWSRYFVIRFNTVSQAHAWFYNFTDSNNTSGSPAHTSYLTNDTTYGLAFLQQNGVGALKAPKVTDTASFHVVEIHYTGGGNSSSANYSILVDHVSQTLTTATGDWVFGNGFAGYDTSTDTGNWGNVDIGDIVDFSPVLSSGDKSKMQTWIFSKDGI